MAPDDLNTAQVAVVGGVGLSPTSQDSSATPNNVPAPGPRPDLDTATPTGTAHDTLSGSCPENSTSTTRVSPPPTPSDLIESVEEPAATATEIVSASATTTPTSTTSTTITTPPPVAAAAAATAAATATTTTTTTVTRTTTTTTTTTEAAAETENLETEPIVPETPSAAPTASPQAAVQISTSASPSPATVATPASPSQLRQNGDSKASDTDSDMTSYRPAALATHHGLRVGYSASSPHAPHLASSVPPTSPAHAPGPPTGMVDSQHSSYSASTGASHSNEGYRASSVPSSGSSVPSSNSMSLPSMRTIDAMSQRVSPPYGPHHPVSMSMSAAMTPVSSSPSYYTTQQHAIPVPSNYSLPSDPLGRYPLPHDPRILGSRGPKKVAAVLYTDT